MGPNERQGQLGDVVDELFEAAVFLSPLDDLGNQIDRDVSGVGFGFDFPGEIVARVFLATGTTAVGIAASAAEGDEAGGQDRALGLKFFLAGLEGTANEGGMFRYVHRYCGAFIGPGNMNSIKAYQLQGQKRALRQLFLRGGRRPACDRKPLGATPRRIGKSAEREKSGDYGPKPNLRLHSPTGYLIALGYQSGVGKVRSPAMSRGWLAEAGPAV